MIHVNAKIRSLLRRVLQISWLHRTLKMKNTAYPSDVLNDLIVTNRARVRGLKAAKRMKGIRSNGVPAERTVCGCRKRRQR
jgi:hypothetical protein